MNRQTSDKLYYTVKMVGEPVIHIRLLRRFNPNFVKDT